MSENKVTGESQQEVFIVYLDDNGQPVSAYVHIIEINGFVKFRTNQNIISIPRERVLKIKEKLT